MLPAIITSMGLAMAKVTLWALAVGAVGAGGVTAGTLVA